MKALVVDDNKNDRMLLFKMLTSNGFDVVQARNGVEAIKQVGIEKPDIIISDIMMPEMDGFTLLRALKENRETKFIPLVFYTASYVSDEDKELGLSLGASRFLIKPKEPEELLGEIMAALNEFEAGKIKPAEPAITEEEYLKKYSERIFLKLESKIKNLEEEIEKRKEVEKALRASEDKLRESEIHYRIVADNTYDWEIWLSPEGKFIYTSPSCRRITGHDAEEFLADPALLYRIIHPDDISAWESHRHNMKQKMKPDEVEFRIIHRDGTHRWINHVCQPVYDSKGRFLGVRGSNRDITKRKRTEEDLFKGEERWRSLIQNAPNLIVIIDRDEKITFMNYVLTGFDINQVIGHSVYEFVQTEAVDVMRRAFERVFATGGSETYEIMGYGDGRNPAWYSSRVGAIKQEGEVVSLLIISSDITERKRAEEALSKRDAEFKEAQRVGKTGNWEWDIKTDTITWSDELYRILGYDRKKSTPGYLKHLKLYTPESQAILDAAVKICMETGKPYELDLEQVPFNGERHWLTACGEVKRDATGEIDGLRGTAHDITERKLAEEAWRKNEKSLRDAQRLAHIGSWQWTVETDTVKWSEELYHINGLDPNSPAPSYAEMSSCYTPESWKRLSAAVAKALQSGESYELDLDMVRPDGTIIHTSARGEADYDASGKIIGLQGTVQDITERRQIEEAKERLSRIVEMATDFISIADHDGRLNYINPAGRKMMGISLYEDISDLYIPYIFTDTAQDMLMNEAISTAIQSGVWNGETVMKSCEGKDIPVSMALIAYKDPSDNIESFFIIARDISERKYIEELRLAKYEAERASAVKSEFLAKMSHELRTPLNAVMGFSEILRMKGVGDLNEKQERYVINIFNSGRHLLDIISDMLDLLKVESGEILPLVIESFSAPEAIEKTMVFVNGKAEKKNIMIKKEIDPELDMISADKLRFKQILMNLIDNAIKFSKPEGGTVTITAGKAGDMAQFSVSDTGIGIKEEDKEKLFSLFHQVDSGLSRKYGGTGIGLAITKQLVEQHGGRIWAQSKYGEGSTFTFTLPIEVKKRDLI